MQLNFLSASNGLPLTKTFSATGSTPYPLVTHVDSHTFSVDTISDFHDTLRQQSQLGHCLLKGDLKQPLVNESRKGKSTPICLSSTSTACAYPIQSSQLAH